MHMALDLAVLEEARRRALEALPKGESMVHAATPEETQTYVNSNGFSRRNFLERAAKLGGIGLIGGLGAVLQACGGGVGLDRRVSLAGTGVDTRNEELVNWVKDSVTLRYYREGPIDPKKIEAMRAVRKKYGIKSSQRDYLNVNHLIPRGLFLLEFPHETAKYNVFKIMTIHKIDTFNGFINDEGKKQSTYFGIPFGSYKRVLLGEELFSTHDVAPGGAHYKLPLYDATGRMIGSEFAITLPYKWMKDNFPRYSQDTIDRVMETLTMHEIAHITLNGEGEILPILVEMGHRLDPGVAIKNDQDIITYSNKKKASGKFMYHQGKSHLFKRMSDGRGHKEDSLILAEGNKICEKLNKIDPSYLPYMVGQRFIRDLDPKDRIADQQSYAIAAFLFNKYFKEMNVRVNPAN